MLNSQILFFIWLPVVLVTIFIQKKREKSSRMIFVFVLFISYIFLLIANTFFPIPIDRDIIEGISNDANKAYYSNQISMEPFASMRDAYIYGGKRGALYQIGGNISLLAPLAFFAPIIWKRFQNFKQVIVFVILVSFMIEFLQYYLKFLHGFRIADIDDFMLNIAGGILGYCGYVVVRGVMKRYKFLHLSYARD